MTEHEKNTHLVFSIAVHESAESVYDLVDNINYFCLNPLIVIHVPQDSKMTLDISKYNNVYINRTKLLTGYVDGTLTFVHIENYLECKRIGLQFDYFIPFGSNQLFIKSGIENYIHNSVKNESSSPEKKDYHYKVYLRDKSAYKLLESNIRKSAPEGTYYRYDVMEYMLSSGVEQYYKKNIWAYRCQLGFRIRKFSSLLTRVMVKLKLVSLVPSFMAKFSYASEEIIFPSIKYAGIERKVFCFIPWERENIKVTIKDIEYLICQNSHYYTVKRVERDYYDEIRVFIRENIAEGYKKNKPNQV
ncbi:hypothetical protein GKR71_14775 [Providencia sp. wls1922]|uniref:hypothetical protein n=1 Tax=Providencia sp. wls1922 TaxID=2675152 RepID=UPI0012B676BB|nr:hypothetical protein [Providencia sp. wls1922]